MTETTSIPEIEPPEEFSSPEKYAKSLAEFDAALCEGCAVCQKLNEQTFPPSFGFSTYVFARIVACGRNIMRSVPRSKWCSADYADWDFGANAGSFRSILEASLLFHYLYGAYFDPDDEGAAVQLMHLYDLKKRETIFCDGNVDSELGHNQEEEIVDRLTGTKRFHQLPPDVQENALQGRVLMLESKEEIIQCIGWDRERFYLLWNTQAHVKICACLFTSCLSQWTKWVSDWNGKRFRSGVPGIGLGNLCSDIGRYHRQNLRRLS